MCIIVGGAMLGSQPSGSVRQGTNNDLIRGYQLTTISCFVLDVSIYRETKELVRYSNNNML